MRKIGLVTLVFVLAACGQTGGKGAKAVNAGAPDSIPETTTSAVVGETGTSVAPASTTASSHGASTVSPNRSAPQPAPTTTTDLGTPAQASADKVSVAASAASYAANESVTGTVTNGSPATIYTEDEKTGCSILFLERQSGSAWEAMTGCGMQRPPAVVAIGAGRARSATISAQDAQLGASADARFPSGTYRFRFTYRTSSGPSGDEPNTVTSGTFTIS
jgi:hypothetical protein